VATKREPLLLLAIVLIGLVVTYINAYDPATWWMETSFVFIGIAILIPTANRFPLSPLLYRLIAFHCIILMIGGHYTYERVPLGDWMKDWFGFSRNHYDRIGHLVQGFVPAILVRELLLRTSPFGSIRSKWMPALVVSACLAFSAFFEMIEWWSAVAGGATTAAFLGSQGDIWDAQWDMLCALIGAIVALMLLWRAHDRSLQKVKGAQPLAARPRK
jgi:putative membrane protein